MAAPVARLRRRCGRQLSRCSHVVAGGGRRRASGQAAAHGPGGAAARWTVKRRLAYGHAAHRKRTWGIGIHVITLRRPLHRRGADLRRRRGSSVDARAGQAIASAVLRAEKASGHDAPMLRWIDTHCHLDAPEFDADRAAVVARARAAGVSQLVLPAVEVANFDAVRALAQAHDAAYALGIHPLFVERAADADLRHAAPGAAVAPRRSAPGGGGRDRAGPLRARAGPRAPGALLPGATGAGP